MGITYNPGTAEEAASFGPVPVGRYLSRCIDVRTDRTTSEGFDSWGLRHELAAFVQADGQIAVKHVGVGRSVWDNIHFGGNQKALNRTNLILRRLGGVALKPNEAISFDAGVFLGKWAILDIVIEDGIYKCKATKVNRVSFAGYEAAPREVVEQLLKAGLAPKLVSERPRPEGSDTSFGYGANAGEGQE